MSSRWLPLSLLLQASVAVSTIVTQCGPSQYEMKGLGLCCDLCPPGNYVSRPCSATRATQCRLCEPGTYTAHPNSESSCFLCAQCRDDQEEVSSCRPDRNRQCQCKPRAYYCDSLNCVEKCFQCTRCKGTPVKACTATRDAVCAPDASPMPENPSGHFSVPASVEKNMGIGFGVLSICLSVCLFIIVLIVLIVLYYHREQAVQVLQRFIRCLKRQPHEPCHHEMPQPADSEMGPPALDVQVPLLERDSAMVPESTVCPGPPEDAKEEIELQLQEAGGSNTAAEPAPPAPASTPAAGGAQGQAKTAASLQQLEQEYEKEYFLKDANGDAAYNRIYYEFGHKVPDSSWKMLMRLVGLEECCINICEHENPSNLLEQHHKMLLRWQNNLGRKASVFKLMAALHKMGLRMDLQNIINNLVAENILGRHAETPN